MSLVVVEFSGACSIANLRSDIGIPSFPGAAEFFAVTRASRSSFAVKGLSVV